MRASFVPILLEVVDDVIAWMDVAVAEQRLCSAARSEPFEGTLAQLLGQGDERREKRVRSVGDVSQRNTEAARHLCVVDLVDVLGRRWVGAPIAHVGQRVAKSLS